MARHEKPPEGFAVAQLPDGRYYPLRVERFYSAQHPDGMLMLHPHFGRNGDEAASFALRLEALAFCCVRAQLYAGMEQEKFERLAAASLCYPERCAWYMDLITQVTGGKAPQVCRFSSFVLVHVPSYLCARRRYHPQLTVDGLTQDETLAQVAEVIYARATRCGCLPNVSPKEEEGEQYAS